MLCVSARRVPHRIGPLPRSSASVAYFFFFSSRRRHTRLQGDWSSACALPISGRRHLPATHHEKRNTPPWQQNNQSENCWGASRYCRHSTGEPQFVPVVVYSCFIQGAQMAQACLRPELARPLESPLALATSRFHRTAANGPPAITNLPIIHSPSLTLEVFLLSFHSLASLPSWSVQGRNLLENRPLLPMT